MKGLFTKIKLMRAISMVLVFAMVLTSVVTGNYEDVAAQGEESSAYAWGQKYDHIDVRINEGKVTFTEKVDGVIVISNKEEYVTRVTGVSATVNGTSVNNFYKNGSEFRSNTKVPKDATIVLNLTVDYGHYDRYVSRFVKDGDFSFSWEVSTSDITNANKNCPDHSGLDFIVNFNEITNTYTHNVTVKYVDNAGNALNDNAGSVSGVEGTDYSFDIPAEIVKDGIKYVLDDSKVSDGKLTGKVGSTDTTVEVQFKKATFTITWMNGETVLGQNTVNAGDMPSYTGKTPVKDSTNEKNYSFSGWTPDVVAAKADATYYAEFNETDRYYTVKFVNFDGTVLNEGNTQYLWNAMPQAPATPVKPSDVEYDYTFTGWDKAIVAVNGDAVYTAQYSSEKINYTVTFYDENGKVISQKTDYNYGDPVVKPDVPKKEEDATFTYEDARWDKTVSQTVTGNAEYKAVYTPVYKNYTVEFVDENGTTVIFSNAEAHYGDKIVAPATPTKAADKTYTYEFADWTLNGEKVKITDDTTVSGNVKYVATYTKKFIEYTVKFVDENGKDIIAPVNYHYDDTVIQPTEAKIQELIQAKNSAQYSYTFKGWDKEVTKVTVSVTYTIVYNEITNSYKVTFVDEDGKTVLLAAREYPYGTTADKIVKPADPTKASTTEKDYKFAGWEPKVSTVTADVTYVAKYEESVRKYTVTWMNGTTVLGSDEVEYGSTPSYSGETPKKASNAFTYSFTGFRTADGKAVSKVTGDVTYYAQFDTTVTIRYFKYKNAVNTVEDFYDQTMIKGRPTSDFTPVGSAIVLRESDGTLTADIKAELLKAYVKGSVNDRFGTISEEIIDKFVELTGTDAQDNAVDKWYVLKLEADGWHVDGGDFIDYTVRFVYENGENVVAPAIYHYGDTVVVPANPTMAATDEYTYTFNSWSPAVETVKGDATYVAKFDAVKKQYKVTFVDYDDEVILAEKLYDYGSTPTVPTTPTRDADKYNTYAFAGWTVNGEVTTVGTVTKDVVYKASYDATPIEYTVKFVDEDGETLVDSTLNTTYHYGETIVVPADPKKADKEDGSEEYAFAGWTVDGKLVDEITTVIGDVTFVASYNTTKFYFVTYYNEDGTTKYAETVRLQAGTETSALEILGADKATPSKAAVNYPDKDGKAEKYNFAAWLGKLGGVDKNYEVSEEFTVNSDMTFKAYFKALPTYFVVYGETEEGFGVISKTEGSIFYYEDTEELSTIYDTINDSNVSDDLIDSDKQYIAWESISEKDDAYYVTGYVYDNPAVEYYVNGVLVKSETVKNVAYDKEEDTFLGEYTVRDVAYALGLDSVPESYDFDGWNVEYVENIAELSMDDEIETLNPEDEIVVTPAIKKVKLSCTLESQAVITYVEKDNHDVVLGTKTVDLTVGANESKPVDVISGEYKGFTLADDAQAKVTVTAADAGKNIVVEYTRNKYTITFVDEDGTTVLGTIDAVYEQKTGVEDFTLVPSKAPTNDTVYPFTAWTEMVDGVAVVVDKNVVVDRDITYIAQYTPATRLYDVIYVLNGTVYDRSTAAWGTATSVLKNHGWPETYGVTFSGWSCDADYVYGTTYLNGTTSGIPHTPVIIPEPEVEADDGMPYTVTRPGEVEADDDLAPVTPPRRGEVEADVDTGDNSATGLMVGLLGLSIIALVGSSFLGKKKEEEA